MDALSPMPVPIPVKLLIFDLDGTLVDTLEDLANAVNFALQQLNRPTLTLPQVRRYVGEGLNKFLQYALQNPSDGELQEAKSLFRLYYADHLTDHTRPYPGIPEVLAYFSGKTKAVLTNKPIEYSEPILKQLNLDHFFDLIIGGHSGIALKPEPDGILHILQQLTVPAEKAVIIGDGDTDILAGKAAGVITCAVEYGFRPSEVLRKLKADFYIREAGELKALFV